MTHGDCVYGTLLLPNVVVVLSCILRFYGVLLFILTFINFLLHCGLNILINERICVYG